MNLSRRIRNLESKKQHTGTDIQIVMRYPRETSEQAQIRHCQETGLTPEYLTSKRVLIWEVEVVDPDDTLGGNVG